MCANTWKYFTQFIPFKLAESSLQFLLSDALPAPDRLAPGRLVVKFTISFEGFHFSFLSVNKNKIEVFIQYSIAHYSKSQIFVQKFNFDKIFTRFSPKFFLTIFLVKSKLSTAKKSKTTTFLTKIFREFFTPKNRQLFREIKVEFLDKKWGFRTVYNCSQFWRENSNM